MKIVKLVLEIIGYGIVIGLLSVITWMLNGGNHDE